MSIAQGGKLVKMIEGVIKKLKSGLQCYILPQKGRMHGTGTQTVHY